MTTPDVLNPYLNVAAAEIYAAVGRPFGRIAPDYSLLPPLDVPLLEKGRDWVNDQAQLPLRESQWNQEDWVTTASCGTAFCFAGYVGFMLAGDALDHDTQKVTLNDGSEIHVAFFAQYWLGLNGDQERALFYGGNEPGDINRAVDHLVSTS